MSDMGDIFKDWRESGKIKKERNRKNGSEVLVAGGVQFTSHNNGTHLVVDCHIDYWPTTGLFICRKTKFKGRGLKKLIDFYRKTKKVVVT